MNVIEDRRPAHSLALSPGTVLEDRYRIVRLLGGASPFALTYLVRDGTSGEELVLKELLPRVHVSRPGPGSAVRAHTLDDERAFQRMLHAFAREAELVAELRHPGLPAIRSWFESHGTVCWIADPHGGVPLTDFLATAGGRLSAVTAVAIVTGVLGALQALHAEGVLHGHVTPGNVSVTPDLQPVLLGIGTTRHVVGSAKEPPAAYAPIEQYTSNEVGPWTDVHACGALLYTLLVGAPPPTVFERAAGRPLAIPRPVAAMLPDALVHTITAALASLPAERPHSVLELRRRIEDSGVGESHDAPAIPAGERPAAAVIGPEVPAAAAVASIGASQDAAAEAPPLRMVVPARGGLLLPEDAGPDVEIGKPWFDWPVEAFDDPPAPAPWATRIRRAVAVAVAKETPARLLRALKGHSATAAVVLALLLLSFGSIAAIAAIVRDGPPGGSLDDTDVTQRAAETALPAALPFPAAARSTQAAAGALLPLDSIAEGRIGIGLAGAVAAPAPAAPAEPGPAGSTATPERVTRVRATSTEPAFRVSLPADSTIAVVIPAAGGAPAELPLDVQTELREQVAQGALKVEFGDYVGALRIYRATSDRIAALAGAYPASPVLAAARRDVGQATAVARRACIAESTIRQARNESALACG